VIEKGEDLKGELVTRMEIRDVTQVILRQQGLSDKMYSEAIE